MAVRYLDNITGETIQFLGGDIPLDISSEFTLLALVKPLQLVDGGCFMSLADNAVGDTSSRTVASIYVTSGGEVRIGNDLPSYNGVGSGVQVVAGRWYMVAITKDGPNSVPRAHACSREGTWQHANVTAGAMSQVTNTVVTLRLNRFGHSGGVMKQQIAAAAVFDYALTDSELESIEDGAYQIKDLDPVALLRFNQTSVATAVLDDEGDSDQAAISGTTVVLGDNPPDWSFDLVAPPDPNDLPTPPPDLGGGAIPNAERILADYLRSIDDLPRVVNKTPSDQLEPWIRLTLLNAPSMTEPVDHLIRFLFQVDCFAGKDGGRPEANTIGILTREAMKAMPGLTDNAVTSGTECIGDASSTDPSFEPGRESRTQTYYVWMHA